MQKIISHHTRLLKIRTDKKNTGHIYMTDILNLIKRSSDTTLGATHCQFVTAAVNRRGRYKSRIGSTRIAYRGPT